MIRTDLLKGEIARAGYSQSKLANDLGISSKTFYSKMKKGVFNSNEIDAIIEILGIKNPVSIFFAKKVSSEETFDN